MLLFGFPAVRVLLANGTGDFGARVRLRVSGLGFSVLENSRFRFRVVGALTIVTGFWGM